MKIKIRTSTMILTGLVLFLILLVIAGIIYIRILSANWDSSSRPPIGHTLDKEAGESMTFPLPSEISHIRLSGMWECEIIQSDNAELTITLPKGIDPSKIQWDTQQDLLLLDNAERRSFDKEAPTVVITIPDLQYLENEGLSSLVFSGFQEGRNLHISSMSGMTDLKGKDSSFENLVIDLSGAGSIDLSEIPTDNATIHLKGAGSIELHMNGGDITGSLEGVGNITYSGSVQQNTINLSGLGSVTQVQ